MENTCQVCSTKFPVTRRERSKATCGRACAYALRSLKRKETHLSEGGEPKACPDCGTEFLDPTRRLTMVRCPPCTKAMMVRTRREGGTYVQSPERRQWQSEMLRRKYEEGWNPNTPEHREKLSRGMRERWASGRMARTGPHWSQTEEGRQRLSHLAKGRKFSREVCKKMSASASKRVVEGRLLYHRGRGGVREDLGFYVRSSWEANFARVLIHEGREFEYEPTAFELKSGKSYVPDFKVGECYYEVKGYMTSAAQAKIDEFRENFSHIELKIVGPAEYNQLRQTHSGLVNWE